MSLERPIDLDRELADVFKKEEMLAFFDFECPLADGNGLPGLCKISQSRAEASKEPYFSLLFLIDVPEGMRWGEVDAVMERIQWDRIQTRIAHVESVMSLPLLKAVKGVYIRETYIYSAFPREDMTPFLKGAFFPAIVKVTGFRAGDLVIWSDMADILKDVAAFGPSEEKPMPTFLRKLKGLLS